MKKIKSEGNYLTKKTPIKHFLLIMRMTFILLFTCVLCSMAEISYTQNAAVTINKRNVALKEVLNEIEKQTNYLFIYNNEVNTNEKVTVNAKQKAVSEVLNSILKEKDLNYTLEGNHIILSVLEKIDETDNKIVEIIQQQQKKTITGTIVDINGEPIIGANIVEAGTTNGTVTGIDGKFSFNVADDAVLQIFYIGYLTQKINTAGRTNIDIVLQEETIGLEEVVAIGYGTLDKKELTSAVAHISSEDFLSVNSVDPSMIIQGKVSGVSITNTAAADPNNEASIQIRGITSRAAGLGPLIVIDGVSGGNITNINSNDIASIDILKDGAAAAIYGTRGSNGVILITTKMGTKDGKMHTSYNSMLSASVPNNQLDLLSAKEYRQYRTENNPALDFGGDTDWINEITRTGFTHQHTLILSAGNNKSNYRASADYRDATGIDIRSERKEYGGRISVNQETNSGLFKFSLNIAPRIVYRDNSSLDAFKWAADANPTTPIYDPDNPTLYYDFTGQQSDVNPLELLKLEEDGGETKFLDWNGTIKVNLLPLLSKGGNSIHSLNTQITYANQQSDNFNYFYRPSTSTRAITNGFKGEANRSYDKYIQHSLEWVGNYSVQKNDHAFRALVGYSYQYFQNSGMSAANKDFASDVLTYNNIGSGEWANLDGKNGIGSYKNDAKLIAFFGRLNYDYKGRYLATASLRYEGSSRFGANNKWGYFPAVSAGWRISKEPFMSGISWINDLKLRADYGETGNQNFPSYLSLATMTSFGSYYYNGSWFTVWGLGKNPNPELKWEKGKNWNIGLDFSLFDNVLSGSVNYYNRKQQDLLGDYTVPVPPAIQETTFVNVGTMRNTGVELELNAKVFSNKDFSYSIGFVGATNENKFLNFSNNSYTSSGYYDLASMESPNTPGTLQRIEEGKRIGNYYTWAYAGIDSNGDWVVWNKDNTEMIKIGDAKNEDKRVTGNGLPKITASMTNTFTYKNWAMSIFLRGAFDYELFNVHDFYYALPSSQGNVLKKAYGKNAQITKGTNVLTDYFIESGDYVKLDMITLSRTFNFHSKWVENVRLYITGRNLATFTGFSGVDPSTYQTNGLTPGVNLLGGNAGSSYVDANADGNSRAITSGIYATEGTMGTRRYYPTTTQIIFGVQIDF
ncbi:MAG: SusC/RagA family TonB-linked outer membrane protein [Paludibacter sp.]